MICVNKMYGFVFLQLYEDPTVTNSSKVLSQELRWAHNLLPCKMENSSIGFGNMSVCKIVKVKVWLQPKMDGSVEDNKHSISL